MPSARWLSVAIVLAAGAIAATCVHTTTDRCDDGSICPDNTQCRPLTDPMLVTCVTDAQVAACSTVAEGAACSLAGDAGTCFGGACYPATCGDLIRDVSEACDDGNRIADDGCSANCNSLERCGDGLIDLARGEQCDDGTVGISGDGCSSACTSELDFWSAVGPAVLGYRTEHTLVSDPIAGVLMFGGMAGSGSSNTPTRETWRWSAETWQLLTPPTGAPSRRSKPAISYDSMRKRVVMFGGRDATGAPLGDLWEWDGLAWTQRMAPGGPTPRQDAGMACGPARCVIFGGSNKTTIFDETWVWNGATWTQLASTPSPPARTAPALAYDAQRQVIVLFGGRTVPTTPLNDTWELTTTWSQRTPAGSPTTFGFPSAAYVESGDPIVMVSGGATYSYDGSTWTTGASVGLSTAKIAYDRGRSRGFVLGEYGEQREWTGTAWLSRPPLRPGGFRGGSLATYDPARGRVLVVDLGRTFEWDGISWQAVPGSGPPSSGAAIAFDRACGTAVVFGGGPSNGTSRVTWTYKGGWTSASPPGPAERKLHAMTYDDKRGVVVMFGGVGMNNTQLDDLWELRGDCAAKQWVEVTPATGPSPRSRAALAYDRVREVSVLFGGTDGVADGFDDTWEWDGTSWTERVSSPAPDPRVDHSMAYDARHRSVVLFGGAFGTANTDDTWRWTGTSWSQVEPLLSPPARAGATLTEDVTGTLILFGGEITSVPPPQIWRLTTSTAGSKTEPCRDASVDLDDDGLRGCADPDCGYRCKPLCMLGTDCAGPSCGDGLCSVVEDYLICPADCPVP